MLDSANVAPCVGAWIETEQERERGKQIQSHPVWVRGLKPMLQRDSLVNKLSHPVWVRGLKLIGVKKPLLLALVAPCVGAWIETSASSTCSAACSGRTLCGCVD